MRKFVFALLAVLLLPFGASFAQDEAACETILVLDLRARASVATTSATYVTIVNLTDEDVTFSGGSTDRAAAVEIHTMMVDDDDIMMMTPLPDGLNIPSGQAVEFAPSGLHVMLIGLADIFVAEDEFDLVLTFDDAGELDLTVPILDIDSSMSMDDTDMDDMQMDDDMDDMDMGHQVSFSGLGECEGLESVWIGGEMDDLNMDDMDMDGDQTIDSLSLTLMFEDGSEVTHELPVINAANMMDMGDMEMDG